MKSIKLQIECNIKEEDNVSLADLGILSDNNDTEYRKGFLFINKINLVYEDENKKGAVITTTDTGTVYCKESIEQVERLIKEQQKAT